MTPSGGVALQLFRTKSPDHLIAEAAAPERQMKRALGPFALTCIGIGAIIGTGIFALAGTAAAGEQLQASILKTPVLNFIQSWISHAPLVFGRPGAGPAVLLSFVVAGVGCGFAVLCYAELASMIPVSGSAYTYSYATLGELIAWIIGWDLILEYAVGNMAVAVGWSGYFVRLFGSLFGLKFPVWVVNDYATAKTIVSQGGESLSNYSSATIPTIAGYPIALNLPALLVVAAVTALLIYGIRESARTNNTIVITKLAVVVFVISFGAFMIHPTNWHPFVPTGIGGVMSGAAIVFFAFIGFDAVSTTAEETKNPQRDMPIGIIASLIICTVLYVLIAAVVDIGSLADLTNIGTLFAFILVCLGVVILRRTDANRPRPFRVPMSPVFPILGVIFCFLLMLSLPLETWIRFFAWLVIGLAIYFLYGVTHSKLRGGVDTGITEDQPPPLIKT